MAQVKPIGKNQLIEAVASRLGERPHHVRRVWNWMLDMMDLYLVNGNDNKVTFTHMFTVQMKPVDSERYTAYTHRLTMQVSDTLSKAVREVSEGNPVIFDAHPHIDLVGAAHMVDIGTDVSQYNLKVPTGWRKDMQADFPDIDAKLISSAILKMIWSWLAYGFDVVFGNIFTARHRVRRAIPANGWHGDKPACLRVTAIRKRGWMHDNFSAKENGNG